MGYFPNGTSAEIYQARYCDHCRHMDPDGGGCPVMDAHILHNYEAVGKDANEALASVLNILIPMDGIEAKQCAMFMPWDSARCTETPDLFAVPG
ncbi:MAG: hypothetical protein EP318_15615 [Rhodobacteraceae bacterium]|nr:MAG: hypothetical protein EP318_15615 [Paracoccaceae bacterium]